jgi:hypothetical protein
MKFIIIFVSISLVFIFGVFFVEEKIVQNLPKTNKFKKWWRKSIVGDVNEMDI